MKIIRTKKQFSKNNASESFIREAFNVFRPKTLVMDKEYCIWPKDFYIEKDKNSLFFRAAGADFTIVISNYDFRFGCKRDLVFVYGYVTRCGDLKEHCNQIAWINLLLKYKFVKIVNVN